MLWTYQLIQASQRLCAVGRVIPTLWKSKKMLVALNAGLSKLWDLCSFQVATQLPERVIATLIINIIVPRAGENSCGLASAFSYFTSFVFDPALGAVR